MTTLNITLDQVISYAIFEGVSEVTYYCPANNYSCYYQFDDQSIHIHRNSLEHTYETLGSDHDNWLDNLDECEIYSILHELGHHLQPNYFRLKDQRYQSEVDAWNRAESILKSLNKEVPNNFYIYRDFKLNTYSDYKHDAQNSSSSTSLQMRDIQKKYEELEKIKNEIKKDNLLIATILSISLLIGGVITFNSLQPKLPSQEQCTDYNCIF